MPCDCDRRKYQQSIHAAILAVGPSECIWRAGRGLDSGLVQGSPQSPKSEISFQETFKMKWMTMTAAAMLFCCVSTTDAMAFHLNRCGGGCGSCGGCAKSSCCAPAPTCCAPAPTCAAPVSCCAPAPTCAAPAASCCNSGCKSSCCKSRCHHNWGCHRTKCCHKSSCCAPAASCCAPAPTCAAPTCAAPTCAAPMASACN